MASLPSTTDDPAFAASGRNVQEGTSKLVLFPIKYGNQQMPKGYFEQEMVKQICSVAYVIVKVLAVAEGFFRFVDCWFSFTLLVSPLNLDIE